MKLHTRSKIRDEFHIYIDTTNVNRLRVINN